MLEWVGCGRFMRLVILFSVSTDVASDLGECMCVSEVPNMTMSYLYAYCLSMYLLRM